MLASYLMSIISESKISCNLIWTLCYRRSLYNPEPVWTQWWREKFPAHAGTRTPRSSSP